MSDSESIIKLQAQVARLQSHVEEQDVEIYKLSIRVDQFAERLKQMDAQMKALHPAGESTEFPPGSAERLTSESPPHY